MRKYFHLNTLKRRMFFTLGICTSICLILVIMVSYTAMRSVEKTKLQTSIITDLNTISRNIDDNYYALLQLSQQMVSAGSLGSKYEEYLTAKTQYDRIVSYKDFQESLGIARFGGKNILVASYILDGSTAYYTNYSLQNTFDLTTLEQILQTDQITFHSAHVSQNCIVNKMVVSIARPTAFANGDTLSIYLESYTDIEDFLQKNSDLQNAHYIFAQADPDGKICYSSAGLSVGDTISLPEPEEFVIEDGYAKTAVRSQFGFTYLLLVPEAEYAREMNLWKRNILIVALIALIVLIVTAFLSINLVYKPITKLEDEMARVGNGDLSASVHHYNIQEFDHLFSQFNQMKTEIGQLIDRIRESDKQNHQLELDKLYYQINPHFLMNTLNTAHWMAVANNQKEIDQYINQLNYILGYSLGKTEISTTFRTEIKSLKAYLELQQVRYDFAYHLDIEEGDYLNKESARLILQPIVENAVCHNMDEFGNLWVSIHAGNDCVHIIIRDDGKGFAVTPENAEEKKESRKNKGIGLRYVQYTLQAFYGGREKMIISSKPGEGTTVEMLLPLREGEEQDVSGIGN